MSKGVSALPRFEAVRIIDFDQSPKEFDFIYIFSTKQNKRQANEERFFMGIIGIWIFSATPTQVLQTKTMINPAMLRDPHCLLLNDPNPETHPRASNLFPLLALTTPPITQSRLRYPGGTYPSESELSWLWLLQLIRMPFL